MKHPIFLPLWIIALLLWIPCMIIGGMGWVCEKIWNTLNSPC